MENRPGGVWHTPSHTIMSFMFIISSFFFVVPSLFTSMLKKTTANNNQFDIFSSTLSLGPVMGCHPD